MIAEPLVILRPVIILSLCTVMTPPIGLVSWEASPLVGVIVFDDHGTTGSLTVLEFKNCKFRTFAVLENEVGP